MAEERLKSLRWQSYEEARRFSAGRKRRSRNLEADHVEEDESIP
ncbi:MAG: hypothetical protein ACTSUH_08850 [Candidatus Thorarchaeota archaeon]